MGGNAFEGLVRLPAAAYRDYAKSVQSQLAGAFQRSAELPYYTHKADFGDLDLLVEKPRPERKQLESLLCERFAITAADIHWNQDYVSFKYQNFQTDLIFVAPEHFESAYFYFAYNDLNNLVGRIAHKFGLKFGWDGLTYQLRTESGHKPEKLQLSTDPAEIYAFLGYDYARWQRGFADLQQIFEFVASSPYFNAEIFELEQLNHLNRTRNRKRSTYQAFLSWLAERSFKAYTFLDDKSVYLVRLHNAFPQADLLGQLKAYALAQARFEARRAKFNGHLVMAWTGLQGAAAGQQIAAFKKAIAHQTGQDFEDWLDQQPAEAVAAAFQTFYRP